MQSMVHGANGYHSSIRIVFLVMGPWTSSWFWLVFLGYLIKQSNSSDDDRLRLIAYILQEI